LVFVYHTINVVIFFERSIKVLSSKLFLSVVLALAVVFGRAGGVSAAAPQPDDAFITEPVQTVEYEADSTSEQSEAAIILRQGPPVGSTLTDFFGDYEIVTGTPSHSFGFGMIAQALWMTEKLHMDGTFFQTILDAKTSGDYSQVSLPEGTIPQNWGELKNAALKGEEENSLGDVVSSINNNKPDHPGKDQENTHKTPPGQSKDKDDDHGWRKDEPEIPPGLAKDKENGNGNHPVTPPGQDKENGKDKDKEKEKGNSGNGKPK
jgi:hypothetical protein